jgi:hypothetical protein
VIYNQLYTVIIKIETHDIRVADIFFNYVIRLSRQNPGTNQERQNNNAGKDKKKLVLE